jgi:hypothetical protein
MMGEMINANKVLEERIQRKGAHVGDCVILWRVMTREIKFEGME